MRHLGLGELEGAVGQRPDHLHEEPVARPEPPVERHAVDAEVVREGAHVDALAGEEAAPAESERGS